MSALNWDKLNNQKKRLDEKLSKGGSGTSAKFWKPRDGENRIRVLPGWASEGDFEGQFWREIAQHWGVSEDQKGPIVCPKQTPYLNGDCPICEFVEELKKAKNDVRAQELVKDLKAKTAYLLNIVDMGDRTYTAADVAEFKKNRPDSDVPFEVGDIKVQVYAAPSTVFNQILNVIQMNEVDITDRSSGHDIIIRKSGKGLKTRYESTIVIKSSKAPECNSIPLDELGFVMDADEMTDLLSSGPGGEFAALPSSTSSNQTAPGQGSARVDDDDDADDLRSRLEEALNG